LENLRVLQVRGSILEILWEDESQAPFQLRELEIDAPLSNIPKSIGRLKHLERIFLDGGGNANLKELPEEFCQLRSLKALVLREFYQMKSLPECFGNLTNLQHIELYQFHNLESLPDSFGNLTNLQHIKISHCFNLKMLPNSFGNLINLQHIDMSNCSDLERLPNSFGNLIKLKFLNLHSCGNLTISSELLGNIITLEYINLINCGKIEVLPLQVAHQRSLEELYMSGTNLKELPSAIGELRNLEVLEVGGSPLLGTLPPSLGDLRNLKELRFVDCWGLKCLPASVGLLSQLIVLRIEDSTLRELPFKKGSLDSSIDKCMPLLYSFKMLGTSEISELSFDESACPNLGHLSVNWCDDLVQIGALPNTLIKLELTACGKLRKVEGLCGLAKLRELHITCCHEVEELPSFETLLSLEELVASSCRKLKSIRGLAQLSKLRIINVSDCDELEELEGVEHCRLLEKLNISGCSRLHLEGGAVEQLRQQLKAGSHKALLSYMFYPFLDIM
jgi:Leucine-rich repeat (LRR) protein